MIIKLARVTSNEPEGIEPDQWSVAWPGGRFVSLAWLGGRLWLRRLRLRLKLRRRQNSVEKEWSRTELSLSVIIASSDIANLDYAVQLSTLFVVLDWFRWIVCIVCASRSFETASSRALARRGVLSRIPPLSPSDEASSLLQRRRRVAFCWWRHRLLLLIFVLAQSLPNAAANNSNQISSRSLPLESRQQTTAKRAVQDQAARLESGPSFQVGVVVVVVVFVFA